MDFKVGQTYYITLPSLGLMELEYIGDSGMRYSPHVFKSDQGKEIKLNDTQIEQIFDSIDAAYIHNYKNQTEFLRDSIDRMEKTINTYKRDLEELHKKYEYLKEKYPEDFI
jgi:hypothetical protein